MTDRGNCGALAAAGRTFLLTLCATVASAVAPLPALAAAQMTVLYSFQGDDPNDGSVPQSGLTAGPDGSFYGTTFVGGANSVGTIYKLTPPKPPSRRWRETILHVFSQDDSGFWPNAGVVVGSDGTLYGATTSDNNSNCGVIYALSPPARPRGAWKYAVLHLLVANDGCDPAASLIMDDAGALYGTASSRGAGNNGTVFKLTPSASGRRWTFKVVYAFPQSGEEGISPTGGLVFDSQGALYGTTAEGGASSDCAAEKINCGAVFKLSPPSAGQTRWQYSLLHTFSDAGTDNEGAVPAYGSSLIFDQTGALYGATVNGGHGEGGTVFQLAPPATKRGSWKLHVLHYLPTESYPNGLLLGNDGSLYGTTSFGGRQGNGDIYELTPSQTARWTYSVLWQFNNTRFGSDPYSALITDDSGALYGTASVGGAADEGTVFKLTP